MKNFKNLKISIKLIICFFITGLLAVAVGVVGIANMNTSNKNAIKIYEDGLIPTKELSIVQKNLVLIQTNYVYMLYQRDATKFEQRVEQIAQLTHQDNEVLHEYENSDLSDEEKILLSALKENLNSYRAIRTGFENYLMSENYTDAERISNEFDAERIKVDDSINSLIEENNLNSELLLQNIQKRFRNSFIFMVVIIAIGLFLSVIIGLFVSRLISKPLHKIVDSANSIANGNLNISLDIDSKDEIGNLAKAFTIMSNKLNEVMSNINIASEQVASGSRQVSDSSISLSQGATEQASSVEQLTASIEEITSQTKQNAQNANEAKELAEAGSHYAVQGNTQMQKLLSAMTEINESSSNIFKIIKVIDEIAFQTNILALNASVESARAGQHGRGFAVVAEEVKNLAQRSANASKETATMIEDSIKKVTEGTKIANSTAEALKSIVEGSSKASVLIGDIAVASNEQAIGIEQINQGVIQISEVVQTTSATSEETASASEELSSQADMLRNQVSTFKLKENNYSSSYKDIENLNPDVLQMLESMSEKNNNTSEEFNSKKETIVQPKNIELSDTEFGKY